MKYRIKQCWGAKRKKLGCIITKETAQNCRIIACRLNTLSSSKHTFGAAIGYSSGKNNSNLKTPPKQTMESHDILFWRTKILVNK